MTLKKVRIAVVGATGNVGRTILQILAEKDVPEDHVAAVASSRTAGHMISYGAHHQLKVQDLKDFDFGPYQIALFSPGGKVSSIYAPQAIARGCLVIDNTSHFRLDDDVPLIIPEVNPAALEDFVQNPTQYRGIIANPNCSLIQLLVALKPLQDYAPIHRVVVSTYQSVSGAGKAAMDELLGQTRAIYMNVSAKSQQFPRPIAFNVIPQIGDFQEDGFTTEEKKIAQEAHKIASISVVSTCVRVPVFIGHSISVNVEFSKKITAKEAKKILRKAKGVLLTDYDDPDNYTTAIECVGDDAVYVSRVRQDPTVENGLCLWVVSDNVRKGAALNAVQIAESYLNLKKKYKN